MQLLPDRDIALGEGQLPEMSRSVAVKLHGVHSPDNMPQRQLSPREIWG